jgi:hypothetical protein
LNCLALESAGHDVTTFIDHDCHFLRVTGDIPPGVFQSKLRIFNALGAGFFRNWFVLRNLEAKFLKTDNLRGLVWEVERNATPRVYAENTPIKTG